LIFGAGTAQALMSIAVAKKVLFDLVKQRSAFSRRDCHLRRVGANVGDFSAAASKTLGRNVVFMLLRPAQDVFAMLSRRFAGNDRIILNNVALGRERSRKAMFGFARDTGMASLVQRKLDNDETIRIPGNG